MNRLDNVRYLMTVADPGELGSCPAEIAFVGRSNVGKSSLLNAVCGKKNLARTSPLPGKTRAINVFIAGDGPWIVDLPGYGFAVGPAAERSGWKDMIEGYLLGRPSLRMVFMLVDAKVGPTRFDHQMAVWLQSNDIPFAVVANKSDKVKPSQQEVRRRDVANELGLRPEDIYWISALKDQGMGELERAVAGILELVPLPRKPRGR